MKRARAAVLVAAVGAAVAVALVGRGGQVAHERELGRAAPARHAGAERTAAQAFLRDLAALPASAAPAFRVGKPRLLRRDRHVSRWASVLRPLAARRAPGLEAAVVGMVGSRTPEGTANLLLVTGEPVRADGRLWVRALLPLLPNGTTGWVPRSSLGGYVFVRTHLVIDRQRLQATLYRDGRPVFRAPVGIGTAASPTPAGRFYVRERVTSLRSPFYGPFAWGTSARSPVLTEWPGGGFVGIHGTDRPDLIPGRISHGCIRLRNPDLLRLGRLMPVGTPVTVR